MTGLQRWDIEVTWLRSARENMLCSDFAATPCLVPRLEISTVPVLADSRLGRETLAEVEKTAEVPLVYGLPRLGGHDFSSPCALLRSRGKNWTAGMDPMGIGSAACWRGVRDG
jgi:hypothetical protein